MSVGEDGQLATVGPIGLAMPQQEGVYEILLSVHRKRFGDNFMRTKPVLQRHLQVVVVAPESAETPPDSQQLVSSNNSDWKLIETIEPSYASWREWLPKVPRLPLLPDFQQKPLSNDRTQKQAYSGAELVELTAGGWQAYPIPIDRTGRPHLVEVEYPSDLPQTLGISVLEPNAVGKLVPLSLDSGVDVSGEAATNSSGLARDKLYFWPRTSTPIILLTNRRETHSALFGKIRVYAGPEQLGANAAKKPLINSRLLAAYFDRPLFPENFTAPETADQWSGRSLKDWATFYEGGRRMVEYLRHVGYNGAIISVACQGGTIYPSQLLNPIPKYDTGRFLATGQDPLPKDVLELLFRMFDQAGLTLVPAVEFSSTLEELEAALQRDPRQAAGIPLVDRQGLTWQQRHGASQGIAPHYNPLDARVQQAMRNVLNEITDRYSSHASFGGLALQLSPKSYALLPGEHWGWDAVTYGRFCRAHKLPAEAPKAPDEATRVKWLQWRAEQLAEFYGRLAQDLQARRNACPLYLATGQLLTSPQLQPLLQPTIPNHLHMDEVLSQLGINMNLLAGDDQIVFFRPERRVAGAPLADEAVNINLATNSAADETFAKLAPAASLFYHEHLVLALPSFDAQSPFGEENTRVRLFSHVAPSAASNRQRFVHHLALRDVQHFADGGWMLPLGQESALQDLFQTFSQLPPGTFQTITPKTTTLPTQPLVVRSRVHDGQTYVYVVNDSPWNVTAEIDIQAPTFCRLRQLGQDKPLSPAWLDGQLTWALDLRPFDVVAAVASHDKAVVNTWRVSVDRATYAQLRQQVEQLKVRTNNLDKPEPIQVLSNPGFDRSADTMPGWGSSNTPGTAIGLDTTVQASGKNSLKMTSNGNVAWVRSDPFPPPKSGRIAVLVRIRTEDPQQQPKLRVAVDGKFKDGGDYYVQRPVGQATKNSIAQQWTPFLLPVNNLPTNQLSYVRIGFDLVGAGTVWIDEVDVYDNWFLKHELDEMMIMSRLTNRLLGMGRVTDCRRILNGYWSQFLLRHVAPEVEQVASLPPAPGQGNAFPPPQPSKDKEEARSSMLDRWKRIPLQLNPFRR